MKPLPPPSDDFKRGLRVGHRIALAQARAELASLRLEWEGEAAAIRREIAALRELHERTRPPLPV